MRLPCSGCTSPPSCLCSGSVKSRVSMCLSVGEWYWVQNGADNDSAEHGLRDVVSNETSVASKLPRAAVLPDRATEHYAKQVRQGGCARPEKSGVERGRHCIQVIQSRCSTRQSDGVLCKAEEIRRLSMASKMWCRTRPPLHPGYPEPLQCPTEQRSAVQSRGDKAAEHGLRIVVLTDAGVVSRLSRAAVWPNRATECCAE